MSTFQREPTESTAAISDSERSAPIKCPTCGAAQEPAKNPSPQQAVAEETTCRRCGSDLQLVVALQQENEQLRRRCLSLLRERRLLLATRLARQCCELSASRANAQLLATCYLLSGDFAAAASCLVERRSMGSSKQ